MSDTIRLEALVAGVEDLAALPDAVLRANELIDSATASIEDIAEVLSLEPSLCARLLKLVNSSFYGFPSQIDTVSRALTLIGTRELRTLMLSTTAVDVFSGISPDILDMNDFWFRSVFVGLAAKHLIDDRRQSEQMFLMGLMMSVGRIIIFSQYPEVGKRIVAEAESSGRPLHVVERELLGFDAVEVSAGLLRSWQVSENLWKPLEYLHHPKDSGGYAHQVAVLQLAVRLANCDEPELKSCRADLLDDVRRETDLLEAAKVDPAQLESVMAAVNMENFEVLGVIYPNAALVF